MPEWDAPDEEGVKRQHEYAAKLCKDCPQFPPDERQSSFFAYVDEMRKKGEMEDPSFISMSGFPASHVEVGWLKDKCIKAVEDLYREFGPYYILDIIDHLIANCVQRMKARTMFYDGSRASIEVFFMTKDNEGSYEYRFGVPTPIED